MDERAVGADGLPPLATERESQADCLSKYGRDAVQRAQVVHSDAADREPRITRDVLASIPERGRAHGLENRLKTRDSLARKFDAKAQTNFVDVDAVPEPQDVNRYTVAVADEKDLWETAVRTTNELQTRGYEVGSADNMFVPGNRYKGLHTQITRRGESFELQFHTDRSLEVKKQTEPLYEIVRDVNRTKAEQVEAYNKSVELSATIPDVQGMDQPGLRLGGTEVRNRPQPSPDKARENAGEPGPLPAAGQRDRPQQGAQAARGTGHQHGTHRTPGVEK